MTAEERSAVEWLEGLDEDRRREYFTPAATAMIGYDPEDCVSTFATIKDDHEGDLEYCVACKDPNAVVVA